MRWNLLERQASSSSAPIPAADSSSTLNARSPESSSSSSSANVADAPTPQRSAPTLSRFEKVLKDEEQYQAAQYPTAEDVPKCMTILDEFLMSYALVPQLRSFYRHGEFVDANWRWHDFKYCLSLKSEPMEVRRQLWIRRKAEWWAARRLGASSEDVWDVRDQPPENFPPLHPEESPEEVVQQDK